MKKNFPAAFKGRDIPSSHRLCSGGGLMVSSLGGGHWLNEYTSDLVEFGTRSSICGHYSVSERINIYI